MMACMILKMGQLFKEYYYIPKWKMLLTPNISTTEEFLYYQKNIYSIWYLCMCILHFFYVIFSDNNLNISQWMNMKWTQVQALVLPQKN